MHRRAEFRRIKVSALAEPPCEVTYALTTRSVIKLILPAQSRSKRPTMQPTDTSAFK